MSEEAAPEEEICDRVWARPMALRDRWVWGVGAGAALALQVRQLTGAWGWVAASGAATIMLGLVFLLLRPASSLAAVGMLLAFNLLVAGFGWIQVGLALRRLIPPTRVA